MFNRYFLSKNQCYSTYSISLRSLSYVFKGLLIIIPITSFGLGTWQYYRLQWKNNLIRDFEERLSKEPLKLTKDIKCKHFVHGLNVWITGKFKHDQEILVGPLLFEGKTGYHVITPIKTSDGYNYLINRGWIPSNMSDQSKRTEGLSNDEVTIQGLIRLPPKNNLFTPTNKPELKKYYYVDIEQMSKLTRSQPIYIEQLLGNPIGKIPQVQIRNNHLEYMFTWYTLSIATSIMLYRALKAPPSLISRRISHAKKFP
ncbi:hypothetical protein PCANB_000699 [Pneumocystis canis]|nr:hypothetical protein PCANB_000699 [Pneumocystis canis]